MQSKSYMYTYKLLCYRFRTRSVFHNAKMLKIDLSNTDIWYRMHRMEIKILR